MNILKKILLGISILIGLSILGLMIYQMTKPDPKKLWPKIKAIITKSEIKTNTINTRKRSYLEYVLELEYSYEINQTKYTNYTYSNIDDIKNGTLDTIKNIKYQYPVGKEIDIFYNIINPQESFITFQKINIIPYIISSLIFLVVVPPIIIFGKPGKPRSRNIQNEKTTISANGVSISF